MKRRFTAVIAIVLIARLGSAENLTETSIEKANAVINAAIEAYGGMESLQALDEVRVASKTKTFAANQSLRPGPPWDENHSSDLDAIKFSEQSLLSYSSGNGGGFDFEGGILLTGNTQLQMDVRGGSATRIADPDYATSAGPFIRVSPPLLLRELTTRENTSHYLGEVDIEDRAHDAISLVMQSGPAITLYVDKETHLVTRSERFAPFFGLIEYRFGDYRPVDGILFNHSFDLYVNDEHNMARVMTDVELGTDFSAYAKQASELSILETPDLPPMQFEEIEDNVYLAGGSNLYALFVDMGDYLIAAGATQNADARIQAMREKFPDKPLRYALITHHHNDHLAGVQAYLDVGATLLVADEHVDVVSALVESDIADRIVSVKKNYRLTSESMSFEARNIGPTAHTNQLLVAYVPAARLVFEADHFSLPADGRVPRAVESTKTFAKALSRSGLKVRSIVSAHSARIGTMDELKKAVKTKAPKNKASISF